LFLISCFVATKNCPYSNFKECTFESRQRKSQWLSSEHTSEFVLPLHFLNILFCKTKSHWIFIFTQSKGTFGLEVLSDIVLRTLIPDSSFQAFKKAAVEGHPLDPNIADQIANAMKEWYLLFSYLSCPFLQRVSQMHWLIKNDNNNNNNNNKIGPYQRALHISLTGFHPWRVQRVKNTIRFWSFLNAMLSTFWISRDENSFVVSLTLRHSPVVRSHHPTEVQTLNFNLCWQGERFVMCRRYPSNLWSSWIYYLGYVQSSLHSKRSQWRYSLHSNRILFLVIVSYHHHTFPCVIVYSVIVWLREREREKDTKIKNKFKKEGKETILS
jgi:hypothetical protein